jgi:hypothetical protein
MQSLLHPPRVRLDALVRALRQADEFEDFLHAATGGFGLKPVEVGPEEERGAAGEGAIDAPLAAEDQADSTADGSGVADDILAEDLDRSRRRQEDRREDLYERGLASAVRTQESEQLPLWNAERDAA